MMKESNDFKLAVQIDAENISHVNIKAIIEEITKYGIATVKRIYGDWTSPTNNGWKDVLLENSITPIQQYRYTIGKNSSDSAMIIDAMDILYAEKVHGFCIVSSDSDFTRLASRLRESGMLVLGIGEKKTPSPFVAACDKFIYIEAIKNILEKPTKMPQEIINLISQTISEVADDSGWAFLGEIGIRLNLKQPGFDPRLYGFTKLTPLIKSIETFEIDERESSNRKIRLVYVKIK